ncbi:hypothetical protein [Mesobacillus stamsii]|uniref:Uncharacterized protein n=1 Tax=Mesobacillus stamsii TaxID=225347 RepID=A0ABU0FSK2_9BACI|nr:hypothetical protein [Mesobacillus stamsii]MDQ0412908.1 hypothetical protein [Mesobacillus stamsii]
MDPKNWEIEFQTGYTFEFVYKAKPSISLKITANSEKEAWKILSHLK